MKWAHLIAAMTAPLTTAATAGTALAEPAAFHRMTSGMDADYVHDVDAGVPAHQVVTLHQEHLFANEDDPLAPAVILNYRLWTDHERPRTDGRHLTDNVEKLVLYGQGYAGGVQVRLGAQEVTWGESPFLPILDVVNPRDVGHPRGFYDPAAKVPEIMANLEWRGDTFNAQLLLAPVPSPLRHPEAASGFEVSEAAPNYDPARAEYGGRLGGTWAGVDSKVYYYKHGPRLPAYSLKAFGGDGDLIPDDRQLETFGLSSSYAGESWLARWDLARHTAMAATNVGTAVEHTALSQAVAGVSWFDDDQNTVAVEVHTDSWARRPVAYTEGAFVDDQTGGETLTGLAVTVSGRLLQGLLEPSAIFYRGLQKNDSLARGVMLWNIDDHWSANIEYQKTATESRSPLLLLNRTETASVRLSYVH